MTPNEIYALPTERFGNVSELMGFYYNHVPEMKEEYYGRFFEIEDKAPRIEIRFVKEFYFDHRRFWRLGSVWFQSNNEMIPVMIIQNAGREGDDHERRFITNSTLYYEMIAYIRSLFPPDVENVLVYDPTANVPGIDYFYDHHLNGNFERHNY